MPGTDWIGTVGDWNFGTDRVWVTEMPKLEWTKKTVDLDLFVFSIVDGRERRWCGITWTSGWFGSTSRDFWGQTYCAVRVKRS